MSDLILSIFTTIANPDNCLHLLNYVVFVCRYIPGVSAAKCYKIFIQTMNAVMNFGDNSPSYHTNHIVNL